MKKLESEFIRFAAMDSTYIFPGDLDLSRLQRLPECSTIIADGSIFLSSLDVLPPRTTLVSKRGVVAIPNVRCAFEGVVISALKIDGDRRALETVSVVDERSIRRDHERRYRHGYDPGDTSRYVSDRMDAEMYAMLMNTPQPMSKPLRNLVGTWASTPFDANA